MSFSRCILSDSERLYFTAYAAVLKHPKFTNLGEFQVAVLHDVETGLGIRY